MICSVMQPTYLPWIGYFDLIDQADHFVLYDDVQFSKQSWHNRNRVKAVNGIVFLTVPLRKSELGSLINEVQIDYSKPWVKKHLKTLFFTYQKAEAFEEVYALFKTLLESKEYASLAELNQAIIIGIANAMSIRTEIQLSSSLPQTDNIRDRRLVEICNHLECKHYLSTKGSSVYIEQETEGGAFTAAGIRLSYHHYVHPEYTQSFGDFEPYMSIVDLLFNEGPEKALHIIQAGRKPLLSSTDL